MLKSSINCDVLPQHLYYVLVLVEAPAPSCIQGEYLPRFIHPTPNHGEHLQARVNQELEIRIKATATFSRYDGKL